LSTSAAVARARALLDGEFDQTRIHSRRGELNRRLSVNLEKVS
jgi:hypothetical protein